MTNHFEGTFITIEGIDGAGKSTIADALADEFGAVTTKEPSNHWTGEQVYRALSDDESPPLTDFFLFMADRVYHIEKTIVPTLQDGEMVISDRYADSTRAYQREQLTAKRSEGGVSVNTDAARRYIEQVMQPWNLEPDLVLYIDISVDTSMERCNQADKYETRENIELVRANYEETFYHGHADRRSAGASSDLSERGENGKRSNVVRIDGEQPVEDVIEDCIKVIVIHESETICPSRTLLN